MNISPLNPFIPENSLVFIEKWLKPYSFIIKIKRERRNKLGDYRKPLANHPHVISVNNNMSKELCLLTLTHEIAHLIAFDLNKTKRILAHGLEWKRVFSDMILDTIQLYPNELQVLLKKYAQNPKAGFFSDKNLAHYFLQLDNPEVLTLKDIEEGKEFILRNKIFIKGKKNKIRYICQEKLTGKKYLISPVAPIQIENAK